MLNHPNISPWPYFEPDEIEAAAQTLTSGKVNYWTGELVKQFETTYAKQTGKQYGLALVNGTVALELALRAFNIQSGDEVIVASRSYVASASCVMLLGATPVFADITSDSGNISADTIKPLITAKTKAVIPVHVGGWPCDMQEIMQLAIKHDLKVIEDCAQAHGASIGGKPVGGWGHAAIFSFCQDKIISTGGEGGMLLLDDEASYKAAWAYKDVGRSYDAVFNQDHPPGFRWLTETAGSNFRMTEFQAAIGLIQLEKLPTWVDKRNKNAHMLTATLNSFDFIEVPTLKGSGNKHAYYRLYASVAKDKMVNGRSNGALRDFLVEQLMEAGVPCFSGSCAEIYREKLFINIAPVVRHENASYFTENVFCFLVHHTISVAQLEQMQLSIKQVLNCVLSN